MPGPRLALLLLPCLLAVPPAAAVEWTYGVQARARAEAFATPEARREQEDRYDLGLLRVRVNGTAKHADWTFQAVAQGSGMTGLPDNGAFGIGPVYTAANDRDTSPSRLGLAELNARWHRDPITLVLGRQKWADGVETMTGIPALDAVKSARLGERLVGNWDWTNVGRRYDGASLGINAEDLHGSLFLLRPLGGGVAYENGLEPLDDLAVAGATLTARYGRWLPRTENRLFVIRYEDDRPGARSAAGSSIDVTTLGTSLLVGDSERDVLLWVAWQTGDWGAVRHEAWASILELGWRPGVAGQPHLRLGVAQASGDPRPGGDHRSFFNLLPTNHKWYGAMDYNAFSNLRDLYLDARGRWAAWSLAAGLHHFSLPETADAWYGGSGAFDDAPLGYAARRTAEGAFPDDAIGWELDLSASRALAPHWEIAAGISWFRGEAAAEAVLPEKADGRWAFLQLQWSR